jgi:hypothetical protein
LDVRDSQTRVAGSLGVGNPWIHLIAEKSLMHAWHAGVAAEFSEMPHRLSTGCWRKTKNKNKKPPRRKVIQ